MLPATSSASSASVFAEPSPTGESVSRPEDVIHHRSEAGWVVLASRVPRLGGATPELAERLLERMDLSRPPVCLIGEREAPPELAVLLDEFETLLGVRPAVLDAGLEPPAELAAISLLILVGGSTRGWIQSLDNTLLGELVLQALAAGGIVLAVGPAAGAVGSWALPNASQDTISGLNWIGSAVILPDETAPGELEPVKGLLRAQTKAFALGLAPDTVVALGPSGEIEVWGEARPTIILGSGWREE